MAPRVLSGDEEAIRHTDIQSNTSALLHIYRVSGSYTLSQAWEALRSWNCRSKRLGNCCSRACRLSMHVCVRAGARLHLLPKSMTENVPSEDVNTSTTIHELLARSSMADSIARLVLVERIQK